MSEWPMVKLGEVCRISIGKTPARKEPRYWGDGLPWLSIKDMNQGPLLNATSETITDTALSELNISPYPAGTVLFSFKLSIGKVGITTKPMFTNEAIAAIEPHNINLLDKPYLAEALRFIGQSLEGNAAVMGITLNKKSLAEINIPLPPLAEQKRIAEILDKISGSIKSTTNELCILNNLARFNFIKNCGNPNTFTSRIELKKIATITTGNTPSRKEKGYYGNHIEWIKSDNLGGVFPSPASESLSQEGMKRGRIADPGSLLMTCIAGSIKSIGKLSITNRKVAFNQQINSIKPHSSDDLHFLYLLFQIAPELVQRRSTGGLKGIVKKSSLESCKIPWPDKRTRKKMSTFCKEWIDLQTLLYKKLTLLQELQRSLSVHAFAGLL